jgi:hypothetical protein
MLMLVVGWLRVRLMEMLTEMLMKKMKKKRRDVVVRMREFVGFGTFARGLGTRRLAEDGDSAAEKGFECLAIG